MKRTLIFVLALMVMYGCEKSSQVHSSIENSDTGIKESGLSEVIEDYGKLNTIKKMVDNISYTFRIVSTAEFIGFQNEETRKSNEHVLIVSIVDLRSKNEIDKLKNILMDNDELSTYLVGPVCSDIEITQSNKTLALNGSLFEGLDTQNGVVRFYVFLENYNPSKEAVIQFYDKVFGNGMMKRSLTKRN
jgi:hypothetical protein